MEQHCISQRQFYKVSLTVLPLKTGVYIPCPLSLGKLVTLMYQPSEEVTFIDFYGEVRKGTQPPLCLLGYKLESKSPCKAPSSPELPGFKEAQMSPCGDSTWQTCTPPDQREAFPGFSCSSSSHLNPHTVFKYIPNI